MSYFPNYSSVTTISASDLISGGSFLVAPGRSGCIVDIKTLIMIYNPGSTAFSSLTEVEATTGSGGNVFSSYAGAIGQISTNALAIQMIWATPWWIVSGSGVDAQPLADVIGQGIELVFSAAGGSGNGTVTALCEATYIVA
jgi:hypothetical protein